MATILPYFLTCWYIHPYFDDYFFSDQISAKGKYSFITYFYTHWSGRYSEEILMALFNIKITTTNIQYFLFGVFILTVVYASFYYLVNVLLKGIVTLSSRILIALVAFTFYLVCLPELFTSFYWNCSSYYQLCLALLLLNGALIIGYFKKPGSRTKKIILLLLNIFIAGFSEITVFTFGLLYFAIVLYQYFTNGNHLRFWLLILLLFWSCAILNIAAPGNLIRMKAANPDNGFLFSAGRAAYDLIIFHIEYTFLRTPYLFFLLICIPWIISFLRSNSPALNIFNVNPYFSVIVTLLIFYIHHALTIYGAGYSLLGRVFNFSVLLFWIAIVYNFFVILKYFSVNINTDQALLPPFAVKPLLITVVFMFGFSENNRLLWGDLFRKLPAFNKQMHQRYALIESAIQNHQAEVAVPPIKAVPKLYLFREEDHCGNSYFVNEEKYLRETGSYFNISVKLSDRIVANEDRIQKR
ncbi:MAG: hypothetical protein HYY40_02865 [Bacteroidetes bacterium]|nr:hypothetical protein [Bacteroidota bacterium]